VRGVEEKLHVVLKLLPGTEGFQQAARASSGGDIDDIIEARVLIF